MTQPIDIQDLLVWAFMQQRVESDPKAEEDAITVYWAVMALPDPYGRIVRHYARHGASPPWRPSQIDGVTLDKLRNAHCVYSGWVRAMAVLQRTLAGSVKEFSVTGPATLEAPWQEERRAWGGGSRARNAA